MGRRGHALSSTRAVVTGRLNYAGAAVFIIGCLPLTDVLVLHPGEQPAPVQRVPHQLGVHQLHELWRQAAQRSLHSSFALCSSHLLG